MTIPYYVVIGVIVGVVAGIGYYIIRTRKTKR